MKVRIFGLLTIATVLTVASLAPRNGSAASPTLETLYSFCALNNCTDGAAPGAYAGLIMDGAGNLYGTTQSGGANNGGVFTGGVANSAGAVFQLTPSGTGWSEKVLYSFCSKVVGIACADGVSPLAGLIMDGSGNLYGTTYGGGTSFDDGVVFELTPNQSKTVWTETVLYSFCSQPLCTDGTGALGSLIMDGAGNLYGTTRQGGANGVATGGTGGVVFELTPNQSKTAWTETVLYSFCSQNSCADGATPYGRLIMDASGNLYGTASAGGANGGVTGGAGGVVFELTPNQSKTAWTETVLYSFCSQVGCTDGEYPFAGLIMDGAGNLYGTTLEGGGANNVGVVFELTPNQSKTAWTETVLYSFCESPVGCADGREPNAGLIMDGAGNLYGTTLFGGANGDPLAGAGAGLVFELMPNQSKTAWTETVLHNFCSQTNCADGFYPQAGLIADGAGNLYSTTEEGGSNASGTVFEITDSGFVAVLSSSQIATKASGLAYSRVSQTFNGTVTITNISNGAISGPLQILFTGLTAGVTLVNATGDFSGAPYLTSTVASLAPGQSVTVGVQFKNPSSATINFTPAIYSGSI